MSKLILAAVIVACSLQHAFAAEPTCGRQFDSKDFRRSDISRLVKKYKKSAPESAIAAELANFGPAVVPFIAKLGCDTNLHFYFMNPKAGIFGWYRDFAYGAHAHAVLEKISDPTAIPNLKKILFEPRIGPGAQDAVNRLALTHGHEPMSPALGTSVLKSIIDNDARAWMVSYSLGRYVKLMAPLTPTERTDVLLYLLDGRKWMPGASFDSGANIHILNDLDWDGWRQLVILLGRTRTSVAMATLERQYSALSQLRMSQAVEPKLNKLLAAYRLALKPDSSSAPDAETDVWSFPVDIIVPPYLNSRPTLSVSISVDGKELIDIDGQHWFGRSLELTEVEGPAFEYHGRVSWKTNTPINFRPLAIISVVEIGPGRHSEGLVEAEPGISKNGAPN